MTRLLFVSGLMGVAIAGFAIGMEEAGVWQQRLSLIFILTASPGIGLLWHFSVWKREKRRRGFRSLFAVLQIG
jgi:hypothetical protein